MECDDMFRQFSSYIDAVNVMAWGVAFKNRVETWEEVGKMGRMAISRLSLGDTRFTQTSPYSNGAEPGVRADACIFEDAQLCL